MIRKGFVANSSSSSFVVSCKGDKVYLEVDITKLGTVVSTVEELENVFAEEFYDDWREEEWYLEKFKEAVDAIKQNEILIVGSIASDDDNAMSCFLYTKGFSVLKNITVIMGE